MLINEKNDQLVSISCGIMLWLALVGCTEPPTAEEQIIALLADDAPYHFVSEELFEKLGWDLPDGGARGVEVGRGRQALDLILLRRGNEVFAYENRCPHKGTPLETFPDKFLDYSRKGFQGRAEIGQVSKRWISLARIVWRFWWPRCPSSSPPSRC